MISIPIDASIPSTTLTGMMAQYLALKAEAPSGEAQPCLALWLSGVSMYLLARDLGLDRLVALFTAVVLMTALRDRDVRDAANRLGALALFEKPFDLHELRTVLLDVTRRA